MKSQIGKGCPESIDVAKGHWYPDTNIIDFANIIKSQMAPKPVIWLNWQPFARKSEMLASLKVAPYMANLTAT